MSTSHPHNGNADLEGDSADLDAPISDTDGIMNDDNNNSDSNNDVSSRSTNRTTDGFIPSGGGGDSRDGFVTPADPIRLPGTPSFPIRPPMFVFHGGDHLQQQHEEYMTPSSVQWQTRAQQQYLSARREIQRRQEPHQQQQQRQQHTTRLRLPAGSRVISNGGNVMITTTGSSAPASAAGSVASINRAATDNSNDINNNNSNNPWSQSESFQFGRAPQQEDVPRALFTLEESIDTSGNGSRDAIGINSSTVNTSNEGERPRHHDGSALFSFGATDNPNLDAALNQDDLFPVLPPNASNLHDDSEHNSRNSGQIMPAEVPVSVVVQPNQGPGRNSLSDTLAASMASTAAVPSGVPSFYTQQSGDTADHRTVNVFGVPHRQPQPSAPAPLTNPNVNPSGPASSSSMAATTDSATSETQNGSDAPGRRTANAFVTPPPQHPPQQPLQPPAAPAPVRIRIPHGARVVYGPNRPTRTAAANIRGRGAPSVFGPGRGHPMIFEMPNPHDPRNQRHPQGSSGSSLPPVPPLEARPLPDAKQIFRPNLFSARTNGVNTNAAENQHASPKHETSGDNEDEKEEKDQSSNNSQDQPRSDDAKMSKKLETFKCCICFEYMADPLGCGKCSGRFCDDCFQQMDTHAKANPTRVDATTTTTQPLCPMCRHPIETPVLDQDVRREILQFDPIPCRYDGCQYQLRLSQVRAHEDTACFYVRLSCKYASVGCPWTGMRGHLSHHLDQQCDYAKLSGFVDQHRRLQQHSTQTIQRLQDQLQGLSTAVNYHQVQILNLQQQQQQQQQQNSRSENGMRVQLTCANPIHVLYFVTTILFTPSLLGGSQHETWEYWHRRPDARGAVFNMVSLFPTGVLASTVMWHGYQTLLGWITDPSKTTPSFNALIVWINDPSVSFDPTFGMLANFFMVVLTSCTVAHCFLFDNSPRSWRPLALPYAGTVAKMLGFESCPNFRVHLHLSTLCLTLLYFHAMHMIAVAHEYALFPVLLTWLCLFGCTIILPLSVAVLSLLMSSSGRPSYSERATVWTTGRAARPLIFALRYGLALWLYGPLPCFDAMSALQVLRHSHVRPLTASGAVAMAFDPKSIILGPSPDILSGVPSKYTAAYLVARFAAMAAFLYQKRGLSMAIPEMDSIGVWNENNGVYFASLWCLVLVITTNVLFRILTWSTAKYAYAMYGKAVKVANQHITLTGGGRQQQQPRSIVTAQQEQMAFVNALSKASSPRGIFIFMFAFVACWNILKVFG